MNISFTLINKCLKRSPATVCLLELLDGCSDNVKPIPWRVIKDIAYDFRHPFYYTQELSLCVRDENGNHSPPKKVKRGGRYLVKAEGSGFKLVKKGATNGHELEVQNTLKERSCDLVLFRSSEPVAEVSNLVPGDYFFFKSSGKILARLIHLPVYEDRLMEIMQDGFSSELELGSAKGGEILLVGGGRGSNTSPYKFILQENIKSNQRRYD